MKLLLPILIILLLFLACQDPLDEEAVRQIIEEEITEAEPEPEEPIEPVWTPEPWHIYILDAADVIQFDYETSTITDYYYMFQSVKLKVEMHNRDYDDTWHWVAGGTA